MNTNCQAPKIKVSGIYKITNKINGKYYIGSSDNIMGIGGRWYEHTNDLKSNRHDNSYLQRSWNKYGESAFDFSIIQKAQKSDLLKTEQEYLNEAKKDGKQCYNLSFVAAGGGFAGHHHSEESKRKMSEKLKGRPSPRKGKKRPEWITKYLADNFLKGEKNVGWKHVDETTKNELFELYKSSGCSVARERAKELGFGTCVFHRRLLGEFRKKLGILPGDKHKLLHYKFLDEKTKDLLFSIWKAEGYYGAEKFAKEHKISTGLVNRTLRELKNQGYKRSNGLLYFNGQRC